MLDLLVHGPDLVLYDDTMKVGLGFWNYRATDRAAVEALLSYLVFAGVAFWLEKKRA